MTRAASGDLKGEPAGAASGRPFDLRGKRAVVTGAASGIGRAIAELFARQGARLLLLDLDADSGEALVERIAASGTDAAFRRCDVSNGADVASAFEELRRVEGGLDILVNNAGIAHIGSVETTTEADLDRLYAVNVKGVYHCAHAAFALMKARGGAILNLGSIAALSGLPERFAYSASKGAVLGMTLSLAADGVSLGIRCNCICPARIHTPFVDGFLKQHYPGREAQVFEQLARAQPMGRMGTPEEVAALALYLCSDAASFVTGSAYTLDGGATSLLIPRA